MTRALALCSALLLLAPAVPAQTVQRQAQVYRCGPEGRDLRDSPCPGAHPPSAPQRIDYDEPSEADARAARQRHLADAREATALAAARRASDVEASRQRTGQLTVPTRPAAASAPLPQAQPARHTRPHKAPKPVKAAKAPKAPKAPKPSTAEPGAKAASTAGH
ncbi:hypothetical protein [Roseateles puraquae]|uniref:DUF4124 domain-containing protein n=1 Tax=Roseateles puraquae TaxID=431059 RepID=A0A254N403_9BURK|nr:hypothetical protein [Roseateles puraquae]MDG0853797.1 hypothetical protein [Roseateles puraquae]OWR02836.1 hypothetical protein CDO81_18630 [Roseateles puraquae]